MKEIIKKFAVFFLFLAIIAFIFSFFGTDKDEGNEISIATLIQEINNDQVASIQVQGMQ